MNRTEAAQRAISFAGPIALAAGTASLTAALVSAATQDRYPAQAGQPHPAPTVTVTATAAEQTPAPRPSLTASGSTVVQAQPASRSQTSGGRTAASTGRSGGGSSTGPRPAPGPSTSPPAAEPSGCQGTVLAAREPLGVLPRCAITIGGNR